MNINNLQVQLQTAVENAATEASTDNTSATLYYLQLAKAVQALNMGQIRTIDQVSNLPSAATHEGWLYFVQDIERLYFSNGTAWADIAPATVYNNAAWAWGEGAVGKLGDNTVTNRSSPVSVVGGYTDWCQVSAGNTHSLGLRQNGTAWAWGSNLQGRLGDNTVVSKSSPVSVVGGFTDWSQVSAGFVFSLAVRTNGTVWGWGQNAAGQLGDCTTVSKSSPVSVVGGYTDWCQVSAGNAHSLGVRTNGTAWAWGCNTSGALGADSSGGGQSSPISVVGGFTDWCQVSAGDQFSLAVRQNGTAWAWGDNTCGPLGTNNNISVSSPVSVVGGFTDWCQVSASKQAFLFSLGIRTNGTLWAWGRNSYGNLGDNTIANKSSPVSVVGGFTNWCQVSAGASTFSAAVRTNGTLWAWGKNNVGQLGNNSTTNQSSPVLPVGGFTDWCQVSAGSYQTLAIRSTQV